ncbi:MAG TPA: hypothetical protein V6D17_03885 [Candidatus Obscuribacterales bacterium]
MNNKLQSKTAAKFMSVVMTACLFASPVFSQTAGENGRYATTGGDSATNENSQREGSRPLLKGGVTYCVPKGTPFKLKIATVPTMAMHMMNRDLEGNLLPAQLGQELTAKTAEDIYVDDHKVIPEGTVFHGKVSKIYPPRRLARPGWLEISFDDLVTPDGKKFAFRAEANNFKPSTAKSKLKGLGRIAAHTAGGAAVGAIMAYSLCGLDYTIAMKGYNIAGGAAAGALIATGYAIMQKGRRATLEPGDDLNMEFDTDLLMPAAVEPTVKKNRNLPGLEITIRKCKTKKDNLEGYMKILDLTVDNASNKDLNSIDLYLEDANGNRHPVCAGLDEESQFNFHVAPDSVENMRVSFRVEFPKLKYNLIWLDHRARRVCFRQALPL